MKIEPHITTRWNWRKLLLEMSFWLVSIILCLSLFDIFFILPTRHKSYFNNRIAFIAHRGGNSYYPEGTLLAYQHNVASHLDELDIDIHETKDHHLVIMHDDKLDRTTNGTGLVKNYTLTQLKKLDAGFNWTKDKMTFPFRGKGLHIMTLEEFFQKFSSQHVQIEIKDNNVSIARQACAIIRQYKMTNNVLLFSYHDNVMRSIRAECPEVASGASKYEIITFLFESYILDGYFNQFAGSALIIPAHYGNHLRLTPTNIKAAHKRSIRIYVYDVNTSDDMQHLINMGVDGIIADDPGLFAKFSE